VIDFVAGAFELCGLWCVGNGLIIANNVRGEIVDVTLSILELLPKFTFGSDGVRFQTL